MRPQQRQLDRRRLHPRPPFGDCRAWIFAHGNAEPRRSATRRRLHIWGGFLVAVTSVIWLLVHSDAERILVAIRENEQRCKYLGRDTVRLKIAVFLFCGVIGAVAGFIFAAYSMVASPELAGFVFGTALVDYESAQLSGDYPFVWKLIIGGIFVLVIVAFPRGLLPMVSSAA
jgi:branched-chain amino acid transport system permease protein